MRLSNVLKEGILVDKRYKNYRHVYPSLVKFQCLAVYENVIDVDRWAVEL